MRDGAHGEKAHGLYSMAGAATARARPARLDLRSIFAALSARSSASRRPDRRLHSHFTGPLAAVELSKASLTRGEGRTVTTHEESDQLVRDVTRRGADDCRAKLARMRWCQASILWLSIRFSGKISKFSKDRCIMAVAYYRLERFLNMAKTMHHTGVEVGARALQDYVAALFV